MSRKKIGWIGLGNMGTPMVKNLLKAGFDVSVFNRTVARTAPVREAGARVVARAADLWAEAEILITMLSDDAALRDIHAGANGLLAGAMAGKTMIDMSTVSPDTSRELAGALSQKGVEYLDAPVAGSVIPAELGQLVIMVGGKKDVYEAALPVFEKLGKASFHLGGQGAGNSTKLAINLLLAFNMQGVAEAVLFAAEKGISPAAMMAVINESAVSNGITKGKTAGIVKQDFKAAFALKHLAKDLRLAKQQGMHTPAGGILQESFQQALAAGFGDQDIAAILPFLEGKKG
jgi:3-hydroxyisobutyrate dehydrogenase